MSSLPLHKHNFSVPVVLSALTGTLMAAVCLPSLLAPRFAYSDAPPATVTPVTPEALAFFENRIRPVLVSNCYSCHGKEAQLGGLRVDSRDALLKGGESGAAIAPGSPEKSILISAVEHIGKVKMPQGGKLKDSEIADLAEWVRMGAPWSSSTAETSKTSLSNKPVVPLWSLQPVKSPALPVVKQVTWCQSPLDRFILAGLEAKNLAPTPVADRRTLLRRVTYDLIGLPPTLEETTAFLNDKRPGAYERVVDRLLASPHYGERMARLWLDIARYSDTKGYVFQEDRNYPNAYTYRDWVIHAFNRDLSYNDFIIRQLAADRLPQSEDKSDLAALGFLTVGRRFLNAEPDIIDDRIDVTMRGLQGFTVACARCHDHKFDPIPTQDYYSLYAVFAASKEASPQIAKEPVQVAMAMEDKEKPGEQRIFKRGNPGNQGDIAPRRFLLALSPKDKPRTEWTNGSGRLELARSIASPDNPLTARVFVNRVWRWHFGQGIVRTPSDFGKQGEKPTHPELLDYLATQFIADGWSIKKLHRRIVLSATYQQASRFDAKSYAVDPENRLLWRQNRRRLDLEQVRDSLLFASGKLDLKAVGGVSEEMWKPPFLTRRALYGKIERQNLPQTFRTFDFASPDATNAGRFVTTVPQQALFFLNAPFVIEQARGLAAMPEIAEATDDTRRIQNLYRHLFGRNPQPDELALGIRFLASGSNSVALAPISPWQYGYGALNATEDRTAAFTPLPYFTGSGYQGGPAFPDPTLNYLLLLPDSGHPGVDDKHAVIRRFVAPRDIVVTVSGTLMHPNKEGDGVQVVVVSSRTGVVVRGAAHNNRTEITAQNVLLQRGDTLDFVTEPGPGGNNSDSFAWAPILTETGGKHQVWSAKGDFSGPNVVPLRRREEYVQALLMTNEFVFVD